MITVIAKRIDRKGSAGVRGLINYMTDPEREKSGERCAARYFQNFSVAAPKPEEAALEMELDQTLVRRPNSGLLDHWVISFNGESEDERPTPDQAMTAARIWLENMGYGRQGEHKAMAAVHVNTEHTHVHIAVSRVNCLTGKIKDRKFWKLDNQRTLAKIAERLRFDVEEGARFRPGNEEELPRAAEYHPGDTASRMERHREEISGKTRLHDALKEVHERIRNDLPVMKWGNIHYRLAEAGIEMRKAEHGKQGGLVFSLDGENWASASQLGLPEMSWKSLSQNRGSWRNPTQNAKDKLAEARAALPRPEPPKPKPASPTPDKPKKEAPKWKRAPANLKRKFVSGFIVEIGLKTRIIEEFRQPEEIDRLAVDKATAEALFRAGATADQVYSHLLFYGCQAEEENVNRKKLDRELRELAIGLAPETPVNNYGRIYPDSFKRSTVSVWKELFSPEAKGLLARIRRIKKLRKEEQEKKKKLRLAYEIMRKAIEDRRTEQRKNFMSFGKLSFSEQRDVLEAASQQTPSIKDHFAFSDKPIKPKHADCMKSNASGITRKTIRNANVLDSGGIIQPAISIEENQHESFDNRPLDTGQTSDIAGRQETARKRMGQTQIRRMRHIR